jgi:uncharacterized membrane protein required for colicin V production
MPKNRLTSRLLAALLTLVVISALSLLLPANLPGELSTAELTTRAGSLCAKCPPTEQLTGVGMKAGDHEWYVNVRFAAPPVNSRLRLSLSGVPGAIDLQQSGKEWRHSHRSPATSPIVIGIAQREDLVVVTIPGDVRTDGMAVETVSGDRWPASGFAAATFQSTTRFNTTDAVLLLVLLGAAAFGYRRGAVTEGGDLIVVGISLAIAALALGPVRAMLSRLIDDPKAAAAMASAALVLIVSLAGFLAVPRVTAWLTRSVPLAPAMNGAIGSLSATVRQLVALAMFLAIGTRVALLSWAAMSINSSLLGTALLHAWSRLFAIA